MEKHTELLFRKWCEENGLIAIKVGQEGWPDRLVVGPKGRAQWVEFKTPQTGPEPHQQARLDWLWRHQHLATVVRTIKEARMAVRWMLR